MNSPIWDVLADWELNADFDSANTGRIQAAFDAQHPRYLIYRGQQGRRILYHFTRMVAAEPDELRLHTKRIYLSIACYDSDALEGAFADFLLVLGSKGPKLRKRLFEQARPVMKPKVRNIIEHAIEEDDLSVLSQLSTEHSVLINGRFQPYRLHG
ncbi:MAG: hypothetical protein CSA60_04015 [Neptuniibacter caesariensis]|uniref:Uncharacterized protein n=1 Tax=Neptuniibacter caesariensis TaxID=207954 RepID=A0A2G6JK30_NEPCE|nr:MAG: hypothetical protein CSA60_04015 [Neptuniibacter caesariensis]